MDGADVLIIMDGGLAGAIACAMECERGLRVVAWQAPPDTGSPSRESAPPEALRAGTLVRTQAELYGATEVVGGVGTSSDPSAMLLSAARAAGSRGAQRVVWPRACGESIEEMFRVTERADLASRLAALDADEPGGDRPRIETPFVDLTREQLMDLARDLEITDSVWAAAPVFRWPVGPDAGGAAVA